MQARESPCPLIKKQKTGHVGNAALKLFIILRVGYWYVLRKMDVELVIYLVLLTGFKLNALLLQVQCTFTSKNKMQRHLENRLF